MKIKPLEMSIPIQVKTGWFLIGLMESVLVFAGALFSPALLLLAVGMGVTVLWIFKAPVKIAFLVVFAVPLLPILHPEIQPFAFWTLSGLLLCSAWICWLQGGILLRLSKPLLAFIGTQLTVLLLATMVSTHLSLGLHECFVKGMIWILFLALSIVVDDRNLISIVLVLIFSTLMMATLAIPDLGSAESWLSSTPMAEKRLGSFYQNANNFAIPFLIAIPYLAALLIKSDTSAIPRILGAGIFIFSLIVVTMTKSRSAYLATAVSLSIVLLSSRRGRAVLMLSVAGFMVSLSWTGKAILFLLRIEEGLSGRIHLWRAAWKMIQKYPWMGTGPGTYELEKGAYILPADWVGRVTHSSTLPGAAHNLFLTWGAELGMAAALILSGIWFYMLARWFRLYRSIKGDLNRAVWLGSIAVLAGITARGWFESGLIANDMSDCIYFLIPLLILSRLENRPV